MKRLLDQKEPAAMAVLIAVQSVCAAFFIADAAGDFLNFGGGALLDWHLGLEAAAALSLAVAIALEARYLGTLLRRKARLEHSLSAASGALHELIEEQFRLWKLTPAEEDVALFTIKGLSIAEIAALRGSAIGTVKSQLGAIYRKAGVTGRGGLLSLLIEDLLDRPLLPGGRDAA